jgi:serine protease AprX
MKIHLFLGLSLLLSAFITNEDDFWREKVSPDLLIELEEGSTKEFIVFFRNQADISSSKQLTTKEAKGHYVYKRLAEHAANTQSGVIRMLAEQNISYRSFYIVNAIHTKGNLQLVRALAQREEVAQIQPNPTVQLDLVSESTNDEVSFREDLEWGLEKIGVQQAWDSGFSGQGVVVGGQDTGYEWEHLAIKEKYRGWDGTTADHNYHWHDAIHEISPLHGDTSNSPDLNPCGLDSAFPCDDHNHGTHTMGTMVGELSDEGKHIGVAPNAKWIACRNMERGYGSPASYIECFEWFLAPTDLNGENPNPDMAPHVIANSWSCPEMEGCVPENFELMQMAVDNLKASGVVVVVSAGNNGGAGCSSVNTPAAIFENSFSVGATQQNDTIAGFSSRGPVLVDDSGRLKPNVSAPGVGVRSCIRNGGFASYSGTSMAGPHVAGVVALLISAKPELAGQVEMIENIIEQTAKPMLSHQNCGDFAGDQIPNPVYGYGRIDIPAALDYLGVTNIENIAVKPTIRVYPNPSKDIIRFELQDNQESGTLTIINLQGQVVFQSSWGIQESSKQLSLQAYPNGIYLYQLQLGEELFSGKIHKLD